MEALLYGVAVLACPIGMGLMMWMMMRGQRRDTSGLTVSSAPTDRAAEIDALRGEIAQLKAGRAARSTGEY
jgi:hypothetical protein